MREAQQHCCRALSTGAAAAPKPHGGHPHSTDEDAGRRRGPWLQSGVCLPGPAHCPLGGWSGSASLTRHMEKLTCVSPTGACGRVQPPLLFCGLHEPCAVRALSHCSRLHAALLCCGPGPEGCCCSGDTELVPDRHRCWRSPGAFAPPDCKELLILLQGQYRAFGESISTFPVFTSWGNCIYSLFTWGLGGKGGAYHALNWKPASFLKLLQ